MKQTTHQHILQRVLLALAIVLVILAAGCSRATPAATGTEASSAQLQPTVGQPVPEFSLDNLAGQPVSPADLRGSPAILHFWATWCKYCVAELQTLSDLQESYGETVAVVDINIGEDDQLVREFLAERDYNWTFLLDPGKKLFNQFGFRGVPVTIVLDPEGTVLSIRYGVVPEGELEGWLIEALR